MPLALSLNCLLYKNALYIYHQLYHFLYLDRLRFIVNVKVPDTSVVLSENSSTVTTAALRQKSGFEQPAEIRIQKEVSEVIYSPTYRYIMNANSAVPAATFVFSLVNRICRVLLSTLIRCTAI